MTKPRTATEVKLSQPIKVEIIKQQETSKMPPWMPKAVLIITLFLLIISIFGLGMLIFIHDSTSTKNNDITILQDWPSLSCLRDPFTVTVIVQNQGTTPLGGFLTLSINPVATVGLETDGATTVKVENLAPGASFTQNYNLTPLSYPDKGFLTLSASFADKIENPPVVSTPEGKIRLINVPYLQTVLKWLLSGSGLIAMLTGLFWDQLKKDFE
jgi:hypothetical protein